MALLAIPVRSDILAYQFRIVLDEETFLLKFRFNSRLNKWIMDIFTNEDVAILLGRPLISQISIDRIFVDSRLPEGQIVPFNSTENFVDAVINTLGVEVDLFYEEAV